MIKSSWHHPKSPVWAKYGQYLAVFMSTLKKYPCKADMLHGQNLAILSSSKLFRLCVHEDIRGIHALEKMLFIE